MPARARAKRRDRDELGRVVDQRKATRDHEEAAATAMPPARGIGDGVDPPVVRQVDHLVAGSTNAPDDRRQDEGDERGGDER